MVLPFLSIKIGNEVSVMLKKPIGIGIENYKRLVKKPYYYVDKTLTIKDLSGRPFTMDFCWDC